MAKRFRDTRSFRDDFVRKLHPEYKLLWFYILDECDHAGIWKVDIEAANFFTGCQCDYESALEFFSEKIQVLDTKNWFVLGFIKFQYGKLNSTNKVHRSVEALLDSKGLGRGALGLKDKEQDTDKDKAKDKDKDNLSDDASARILAGRKAQAKEVRDYWHSEFEKLFGRKAAFIPAPERVERELLLVEQLGPSELKKRADNNLRDGYKTSPTYNDFLKNNEDYATLRKKYVQGPKSDYESKRGKQEDVGKMVEGFAKQWGLK